MRQNRSSAVMQQCKEAHDSLNDFPTPPWATRALCEQLHEPLNMMTCREPAANRGYMARPLQEYFHQVCAADIFDYGAGYQVNDYLFGPEPAPVDWTITNPPFRLAHQFIVRALATSTVGVAIFARIAFLEGKTRHRDLFTRNPPSRILQFAERVVIHKGKIVPKGKSATAYCWLVWHSRTNNSTLFEWIAPCRKRLEVPEDYL